MDWSLHVTLDAVDITDKLIAGPVVESGESQSGLADIQFMPGVVEEFRGQTLAISIDTGTGLRTIHSARVITSQADVLTGEYRLQSSTELQEHFRAMADEAAVLAALPGAIYSDAVFGANEDRWKWTQDALSTIPAECHLTVAGTLEVTDWTAKATADHILTGADIHNIDANAYEERAGDDQVNSIVIEYGYGYEQWKSREHTYSYDLSYNNPTNQLDWCDWYTALGQDAFDLPMVDTVRSAIAGTGWAVSYEEYKGHPEAANCGGSTWDLGAEKSIEEGRVTNATARLFKNFTQPIGEDYTITVQSSASIARYGTVTRTRSYGRDIPADGDTFNDDSGFQSGWSVDNIGDSYENQDDEVTRLADIQCAIQAAAVTEWERHRNWLTVAVDISHEITLADTVELAGVVLRSGTLEAKGKVANVKYLLDKDKPRLELKLAITRGGGGTGDTLTPPASPPIDQVHTAPPSSSQLLNHVGYRIDSPDYGTVGETWTGWIINSKGVFIPPNVPTEEQTYPVNEFRVGTVGIEDEAVNELAVTATATYNVAIPDDPFAIT